MYDFRHRTCVKEKRGTNKKKTTKMSYINSCLERSLIKF